MTEPDPQIVLDVTSVRLRETRCPGTEVLLDLTAFRAAEPDPLRTDAPVVLAHLREAHGADLVHCVRSQGHGDAAWVEPRRLDRYGLELLVVSPDAVSELRLPFPRPLSSLDELGPGLRSALTCRCRSVPPDERASS